MCQQQSQGRQGRLSVGAKSFAVVLIVSADFKSQLREVEQCFEFY